mmetsp:Transcript_115528/g.333760  ORF Transcript_115528/g.333760 Transcript_115528/m.333760 type:complete len:147 (-) Transcript_115528:105-545(-)
MREGTMSSIMQKPGKGNAKNVFAGCAIGRVSFFQSSAHVKGEMGNTNAVIESCVGSTGVNVMSCSQLSKISKTLNRPCIHDLCHEWTEVNRTVDFIVVSQPPLARVYAVWYQRLGVESVSIGSFPTALRDRRSGADASVCRPLAII